jgi:hypothetical protein
MIQPGRTNFTIWRGGTFRKALTYHTGDLNSDPYDLTDYTAEFRIRDKPEGSTILVSLIDGDGITLGDDLGIIEITIPAADTAVDWSTGAYELEITAPGGGDTDILLVGGVTVHGPRNS